MKRSMIRLWRESAGQDLVEYALLTAFIALTTVGGVALLTNALSAAYSAWDSGEQNLWEPPNPS
jgi:Flp pilus assembly pilin Flp